MRWTKEQYQAYENRRATPGSNVKPVVQHALERKTQRGSSNPERFAVVVTSFRVRLVDDDALVGKYFVDALRYSGLLASDSAGKLDYKVRQEKVTSKSDERTEIEIIPL